VESSLSGEAVRRARVRARPSGPAWVLRDRAGSLADIIGERAPVRLLGGFDTFLLGYADRSLHLPAEHAKEVNAGDGILRPIVLDDGRAVATWSFGRRRPPEVIPFPDEHPDTAAEAADVVRFLA
jgi:hypothetical protein